MNLNITSVAFLLLVALASCGIPATRLGDNGPWVPKNNNAYINRVKFDTSILKYIDTGVVYEEIGSKDNSGLHFRWYKDYEMYNFGILRFYPNGFMNFFIMYNDPPWKPGEFDSAYHGVRGIYFKEEDKIKGELFFAYKRRIKKSNLTIIPKGDTLFVMRGNSDNRQDVYLKRKLSPEYLNYKISE